jgi:hypothetical protein
VVPRAKRNELAGQRAGALLVRVTAPPVDGKANAAVCRLIARRAGVPPSRVSVVRGASARDKVVRVEGVEASALRAAVGLAAGP